LHVNKLLLSEELLIVHSKYQPHAKDAIAQPVSTQVTLAFAIAQHFSRPFAYTFTKPTSYSALEICTPLTHATLCITVASSQFTISTTRTQWATKLHPRQQVAIAREELHTQSHPQRWIACAQKCKGRKPGSHSCLSYCDQL
jgi:hypothetical protein